jgi:DoxX-like family
MQSNTAAPLLGTRIWAARVVSLIPILMMTFSGILKLMNFPAVVQGFVQLGIPADLILNIGIIELACTVIYAIPATSILGAILLTGLLGGATAANLRVGNGPTFMPIILGVLIWGGLYLRDARLRSLIPLRSSPQTTDTSRG